MEDAECTAQEAVARALDAVGTKRGHYLYGSGDYRPQGDHDEPWSEGGGSDCAGFAICWCWKIRRHRPGFNVGPWASVSDDVNVNSAIEDADHQGKLFRRVDVGFPRDGEQWLTVQPGDLLCYPTFRAWGTLHIGHVGIVLRVMKDFVFGRWDLLRLAQCHGPNGFTPGAVITDGSVWTNHDWRWSRPEQRTRVIRPLERTG